MTNDQNLRQVDMQSLDTCKLSSEPLLKEANDFLMSKAFGNNKSTPIVNNKDTSCVIRSRKVFLSLRNENTLRVIGSKKVFFTLRIKDEQAYQAFLSSLNLAHDEVIKGIFYAPNVNHEGVIGLTA